MRIAFSSLACPDRSVEEIAAAARRFGYDGVEWRLADGALLGGRTDDSVWRRIAASGVEAVCLDTSAALVHADGEARAKAVRHAVRMAERAIEIGAPFVRIFGGAIPDGSSRDGALGPARETLADIAANVPSRTKVLVETHDAWTRASDVMDLISGIEGVGVLWDVAHTLRSGETAAETLDRVGMPGLVHMKDASGDRLTHLGEGDLALRDALEALERTNYDDYLSVEWEKLWHPYLDDADIALPKAITYLRSRP
jgi:sugar phosphate isomerase/epimerase